MTNSKPDALPVVACWQCGTHMTLPELSVNDSCCPECEAEIELEPYLADALNLVAHRDAELSELRERAAFNSDRADANAVRANKNAQRCNELTEELTTLRARLAELEQQKPVSLPVLPQPIQSTPEMSEEKRSEARGFNFGLHAVANLTHVFYNAKNSCGSCFGVGRRGMAGMAVKCRICEGTGVVGPLLSVDAAPSQVADGVLQVPRELLTNFIEYSEVHKDGVQSLWQVNKDKLRALLATSQEQAK